MNYQAASSSLMLTANIVLLHELISDELLKMAPLGSQLTIEENQTVRDRAIRKWKKVVYEA